jgi:hypothetical protein
MLTKSALTGEENGLSGKPAVTHLQSEIFTAVAWPSFGNPIALSPSGSQVCQTRLIGRAIVLAIRGRKPEYVASWCPITMNLKEITKNVLAEVKKLEGGNQQEKILAQELRAVADRIDEHRKANERPITAETLKQIRVGSPQFEPRKL